jgi:hypothetical protein
MAKCHDAIGQTEEAYPYYVQAKELDICPLRILEPMNETILETARETDTPLLDVRRLYEDLSDVGIPGDYYLIDHVHPSIAGHRLIADALTRQMARHGMLNPQAGWKRQVDMRVEGYLDSLGAMYFNRGQERLEALRLWTQGKAGQSPTPRPTQTP